MLVPWRVSSIIYLSLSSPSICQKISPQCHLPEHCYSDPPKARRNRRKKTKAKRRAVPPIGSQHRSARCPARIEVSKSKYIRFAYLYIIYMYIYIYKYTLHDTTLELQLQWQLNLLHHITLHYTTLRHVAFHYINIKYSWYHQFWSLLRWKPAAG